jgi:DNA-binding NarL/FixJ family response regulator
MLRLTRDLRLWRTPPPARSRVVPTDERPGDCHDRLVKISILIVDDDADFLALATRVLEAMDIEVVATAEDAASALTAAAATKPQAALVDVGLPDRDGIELGQQLAALPWRPRVVLTSTDSDAEIASNAVTLPFLPKEDLTTERLRELLGES